MAQFIESITHVDIIQKLKTEHGYWMSLDDALIECEIEAGEPTWQGSPQTASNMAEMETELLNGESTSCEGLPRLSIFNLSSAGVIVVRFWRVIMIFCTWEVTVTEFHWRRSLLPE